MCTARSVSAFKNFTDAISMPVTIVAVFACSTECTSTSGIATMRPNAVQFMPIEMLADSSSALSARSAFDTAVNASMRPMIVPSRPASVAMLENVAR